MKGRIRVDQVAILQKNGDVTACPEKGRKIAETQDAIIVLRFTRNQTLCTKPTSQGRLNPHDPHACSDFLRQRHSRIQNSYCTNIIRNGAQ